VHPIALIPWLDPTAIIEWAGPWALLVVCFIVFAETGLLVGFLLPGDTLLVISGLLTNTNNIFGLNIWVVSLCIALAAFIGGEVGYLIGHKGGPAVFERKESGLFSVKNVERTNAFFHRFGGLTVILARFVPIVRTFTPVVAGVSKMDYRTFVRWNVVGGTLWAWGVTFLGYFLGQVDVIEQNLEAAILLVVVISCLPLVRELLKARREKRQSDLGDAAHDLLEPDARDLVDEARRPDGQL
jgi:membrane-associated protein